MKQVDDAKLFGIQGFCKDLLEVRHKKLIPPNMKNTRYDRTLHGIMDCMTL